jgi:lipopolysaccharide assembly protein A
MKPVKWVVLLLLMVLLIVFLIQNIEAILAATTFEFRLFGLLHVSSKPIPLYALILGSIFGGGLMTAIYLGLGNFRLRSSLRSLERQNSSLQEELKSLRNLPITEAEVVASQPAKTPGSEYAEEAEEAKTG